MELAAVPRGRALFPVRGKFLLRHVFLAEHDVGIVGVGVPGFGLGLGVGDGLQIDRRRAVGAVVLVIPAGAAQQLRHGHAGGLHRRGLRRCAPLLQLGAAAQRQGQAKRV